MSAFEVIGLACFDEAFRRKLFEEFEAALERFPNLTWTEKRGLRRIVKKGQGTSEPMADLGRQLKMVACPHPPDCGWPEDFLTEKPQSYTKDGQSQPDGNND